MAYGVDGVRGMRTTAGASHASRACRVVVACGWHGTARHGKARHGTARHWWCNDGTVDKFRPGRTGRYGTELRTDGRIGTDG